MLLMRSPRHIIVVIQYMFEKLLRDIVHQLQDSTMAFTLTTMKFVQDKLKEVLHFGTSIFPEDIK